MKWPEATFWRCHSCRRGLVTTEDLRFTCSVCGGRLLVPLHRLTLGDRFRMVLMGINPLTRHRPDPELP